MTTDSKKVLIIDDEADVAESLRIAFATSKTYAYDTAIVNTVEEFLSKRMYEEAFDVLLIDLRLAPGCDRERFHGNRLIYLLSCLSARYADALRVVYSGHPTPENIVTAMRYGATDFLAKQDVAPHKVPARIERLWEEAREALARSEKIEGLVAAHQHEWAASYAGRVLALVGEEIVAAGISALDAYAQYLGKLDLLRREGGDYPEIPDLIEV